MPQSFYKIRGIDPLLFRDGRPFTADDGGLTAQSLSMPLPTTIASFIRSQIGTAMGWKDWNQDNCKDAHTIPVHGPLLQKDGEILLTSPLDSLNTRENGVLRMSPRIDLSEGECDLPNGLFPVMLPSEFDDKSVGKAISGYSYWPVSTILKWLEEEDVVVPIPEINGLPDEMRIGIEIDPNSGTAQTSQLYTAQLRAFGERIKDREENISWPTYSLVAKAVLPKEYSVAPCGTLGGERRLTTAEVVDDTPDIWPRCPQTLKSKLSQAKRIRLMLATPAIFKHGWLPEWLEHSGSGEEHLPAGISKVKLKLVGASIGRRVPVSGWGLRECRPREIRWMVPAGSVYFFEVTDGNPEALCQDAWMKPMSDIEQDRRDGLGLALWGTW